VPMGQCRGTIAAIGEARWSSSWTTRSENEGDSSWPRKFATPRKWALLLAHTSGLICVPLTPDRLDELELPSWSRKHRVQRTRSPDCRLPTRHDHGISAGDRAGDDPVAYQPDTKPDDLARPGHVLPLRYRPGGVLKRAGHTEATVDLARFAGCYPAGLLCEIVTTDKQRMARRPELESFRNPSTASRSSRYPISSGTATTAKGSWSGSHRRVIPTEYGGSPPYGFRSMLDGEEHLAFVAGDVHTKESVARPVHSECLTGECVRLASLRLRAAAPSRDAQDRR